MQTRQTLLGLLAAAPGGCAAVLRKLAQAIRNAGVHARNCEGLTSVLHDQLSMPVLFVIARLPANPRSPATISDETVERAAKLIAWNLNSACRNEIRTRVYRPSRAFVMSEGSQPLLTQHRHPRGLKCARDLRPLRVMNPTSTLFSWGKTEKHGTWPGTRMGIYSETGNRTDVYRQPARRHHVGGCEGWIC